MFDFLKYILYFSVGLGWIDPQLKVEAIAIAHILSIAQFNTIAIMETEVWKDIKGYKGRYQISNFGRVKSYANNKEIFRKAVDNGNGYMYIQIKYNNKRKNHYIHRLVADHFISNPCNKPQVNHIDFNIKNNNVNNLEWTLISENINHSIKNGRFKEANKKQSIRLKKTIKDGTNPLLNLSAEAVEKSKKTRKKNYRKENHPMYGRRFGNNPTSKPVNQFTLNGDFIKTWSSASEIQFELNIFSTNISMCCLNKIKQAGGYIWKFKE